MIENLIAKLTPDELIYYNTTKNRIVPFYPTNKVKIISPKSNNNMSQGFMFTMAQFAKYNTSPVPKTIYNPPKNSSKELIEIIDALNSSTEYIERANLSILKNIFECRHFKQNIFSAETDNYDNYTIKAGKTLKCVRCSSNNTILYTKQKRSADEPSETFYVCQDCRCEFKPHVHITGLL